MRECVRDGQRADTLALAETLTPLLTAAVGQAGTRLRAQGAVVPLDGRHKGRQSTYTQGIVKRMRDRMRAALPEEEAQLFLSQGDEGGAVLRPPTRPEHLLGDDEFAVTLRRRLLMRDPAGTRGTCCQNRAKAAAAVCGETQG